MSQAIDTLPEGAPFALGAVLVAALRGSSALAGAQVLDNPLRLTDLSDGERIVFFEDASDRLISQPGQIQKRVYGFNVGVINRSQDARQGAHSDYRAAKRAVIAALPELAAVARTQAVHEGDVVFRIENIDVGGGLVLGAFTIEYRDPT